MTPAVLPSGVPVGCACDQCQTRWRAAWLHHVFKKSLPRAEYDWPALEEADKRSRLR